jgi:hypothetical protein
VIAQGGVKSCFGFIQSALHQLWSPDGATDSFSAPNGRTLRQRGSDFTSGKVMNAQTGKARNPPLCKSSDLV